MDYEPTTTASHPDKWTLNQALMELWFKQLLPTLGLWEQSKEKGNYDRTTRELKGIIKTMVWSVKSSMDYDLDKDKNSKYKKTRELLKALDEAQEEEEVYSVLDVLESFLYSKGVIKWDTKEVVDRKRVWQMNQRFQG